MIAYLDSSKTFAIRRRPGLLLPVESYRCGKEGLHRLPTKTGAPKQGYSTHLSLQMVSPPSSADTALLWCVWGVSPPPPPHCSRRPASPFESGTPSTLACWTSSSSWTPLLKVDFPRLLPAEGMSLLTMLWRVCSGFPPLAVAGRTAAATLGRHVRVTSFLVLDLPLLPPPWIDSGGVYGRSLLGGSPPLSLYPPCGTGGSR